MRFIASQTNGTLITVVLAALFSSAPLMSQNVMAQERTEVSGSPDARCISLNTIQHTDVISDHEILVTLRNDSRLKLFLAGSCPQLEYQGRFTYGATAGQLCAGRDRIITRSGDACLIQKFEETDASE